MLSVALHPISMIRLNPPYRPPPPFFGAPQCAARVFVRHVPRCVPPNTRREDPAELLSLTPSRASHSEERFSSQPVALRRQRIISCCHRGANQSTCQPRSSIQRLRHLPAEPVVWDPNHHLPSSFHSSRRCTIAATFGC